MNTRTLNIAYPKDSSLFVCKIKLLAYYGKLKYINFYIYQKNILAETKRNFLRKEYYLIFWVLGMQIYIFLL